MKWFWLLIKIWHWSTFSFNILQTWIVGGRQNSTGKPYRSCSKIYTPTYPLLKLARDKLPNQDLGPQPRSLEWQYQCDAYTPIRAHIHVCQRNLGKTFISRPLWRKTSGQATHVWSTSSDACDWLSNHDFTRQPPNELHVRHEGFWIHECQVTTHKHFTVRSTLTVTVFDEASKCLGCMLQPVRRSMYARGDTTERKVLYFLDCMLLIGCLSRRSVPCDSHTNLCVISWVISTVVFISTYTYDSSNDWSPHLKLVYYNSNRFDGCEDWRTTQR